MSSNLAVEEPMAADPANNPGGDELREGSSAVESTEQVETRGSIETVVEKKTTVVVTEMKVELLGSELGSEGKTTGGLQGDDLLEVSQENDPSCVESSVVGGAEEANDPTEISLDDLTGGLDIDGKPTGGDLEEVVLEASVENTTGLVSSATEVTEETKTGLVDSLSDKQNPNSGSKPTGEVLEKSALEGSTEKQAGFAEGIEEDKTAEEAGRYTSEKEVGEQGDIEGRLVDGDKPGDKLETQISVEEIKDEITPVEKVIETIDTGKVLEEGADGFSGKDPIVGQLEKMAEGNSGRSDKPDVVVDPTVEENEEVVKEATSDSCTEPMDITPPIEASAVGPVQIVGIENVLAEMPEQVAKSVQPDAPMDIDNALSSEAIEMDSGKEAGGDNEKLEAGEVNADTENSKSGERSTGKEERASVVEENNTKQASANQDGKEAVVYHRREKHQMTKNTTPSPELQKTETTPAETHITYNLPSVDDGFAISDLVWGKVKSHPWWPGVIMNPSDGSNLAMKYQKRDTFLVAYFGDKTFAWCDESQLKPFFPNFSHFERQASSDAFSNAVRSVLVEVSRRFEAGMICSCLDDKLFAKEVYPKLENAGVRQGFVNCAVNRDEIVNHFNPKGLVDFIKDLALVPVKATTDKLELVMVTAQIKAFCRSKGYSVPPKYQTFGPLEEYIEPVIVPTKSEKLPDNCIMQVQTPPAVTPPAVTPSPVELGIVEKPKKKRGRPPKKKKEELDIEVQTPLSELVHKKVHSHLANGSGSNSKPEKTTTDEEDSASHLPWKKRKEVVGFDLVEPENQAQTPRSIGFGISFKIGECISRAASRLTGSVSGSSPLISTPKFDSADFDVSSDDETPTPTPNEEKRRRKRRLKKYHYSDPKEVLSQLCLVATGPTKEYGFLVTIVSYFTDFRNFIVEPPPSTEMDLLPEKVKLKKGRKRKVDLAQTPSDEVVTPTDHMQDSYWSDMILCGQTEEPSSWPKQRKRRVSIETKHLKLSPVGPDAKRALAVAEAATKRPIIRLEEKRLGECNPTALLLSFGTRYGTAPSEMDLVRIFSRYGPLKEWEMGKVEGTANRVWIVFKRRADAEMAFGSLRKQNVFGPSLLSYRLVYEVPEKCEQEKEVEVLNVEENKNVELPEPEETVNLPSVEPGDYVGKIAVDLSNNVEGVAADIMLVDPSSNVEGNDVAQGDDVEDIVVDPSSNVGSVGAEVLSVDPSSNVESVDVAQGDGVDEILVDPSGNVEERDADAMLVDPSSTVQVEAVTEMSTEPLSSMAEVSVDPSSSMQVDAVTKISVDPLSTVRGEAVNEILADPSSTTKVETVSEAAVEPLVMVQGEGVGDVSIAPSSTKLDEDAGELSMDTSDTVRVVAVSEVLADELDTMQGGNVVVASTDLPSTEQSEDVAMAAIEVVKPSVIVQGEAVGDVSSTALDEGAAELSMDTSNTLQVAAVTQVSPDELGTMQGDGVVVAPTDLPSTEQGKDTVSTGCAVQSVAVAVVSVNQSSTVQNSDILVNESNTVPSENIGQITTDPPSILQSEVFGDVSIAPTSAEEGKVVVEAPVDQTSTEEGEVVVEAPVDQTSTEEGKVVVEAPVDQTGTEEGKVVVEAPVDQTSTEEGKVGGVMPVETAKTEQDDKMVVEPASAEQGKVDDEMVVEPASAEQGKADGEMPVEPASAEQGKVDDEMVVEPASAEQGKADGEMVVEPASAEQGKADGEMPVEPSSTGEDEVVSEIPLEPAGTEQGKAVGDASVELPIDPSSTEQGEEGAEEIVEKPVCMAEHLT